MVDIDRVTALSLRNFGSHVAHQGHAMAGAVIAAAAAQAVALGAACMRLSRTALALADAAVDADIAAADGLQQQLFALCDEDATAIARLVALREAGQLLAGQRLLCRAPLTVGRHAVAAAEILQRFRALVHERVRDDLEMSIALLAGAARGALLLLDSNLRIWTDPPLHAEFEPLLAELAAGITRLTPMERIRR